VKRTDCGGACVATISGKRPEPATGSGDPESEWPCRLQLQALAFVSVLRIMASMNTERTDAGPVDNPPGEPTESHDIGSFIRQQRERSAISLRKLADIAGISNPYLSQIERGLRKPSAEILKAIARGLSISAETMYSRAGLLDEWGDRPTVIEAIENDPELDARQRQALLDVYRTFVGGGDNSKEET
jgi:transcriptional regulator with XRE-family HTH domain